MTWNPQNLKSVTLTEARWSAIRTAVLCQSCDARLNGNSADADYWLQAYKDLKEAMEA